MVKKVFGRKQNKNLPLHDEKRTAKVVVFVVFHGSHLARVDRCRIVLQLRNEARRCFGYSCVVWYATNCVCVVQCIGHLSEKKPAQTSWTAPRRSMFTVGGAQTMVLLFTFDYRHIKNPLPLATAITSSIPTTLYIPVPTTLPVSVLVCTVNSTICGESWAFITSQNCTPHHDFQKRCFRLLVRLFTLRFRIDYQPHKTTFSYLRNVDDNKISRSNRWAKNGENLHSGRTNKRARTSR